MTLHYEAKKRWAEIQFWKLFTDIFKIRWELDDIQVVINTTKMFNPDLDYDTILVMAIEAATSDTLRPTRKEFVLFCKDYKIPTNVIEKMTGISGCRIRRLIQDYNTNPFHIHARMSEDWIQMAVDFLNTFYKWRKVGIINAEQGYEKHTLGLIQEFRAGSISDVSL